MGWPWLLCLAGQTWNSQRLCRRLGKGFGRKGSHPRRRFQTIAGSHSEEDFVCFLDADSEQIEDMGEELARARERFRPCLGRQRGRHCLQSRLLHLNKITHRLYKNAVDKLNPKQYFFVLIWNFLHSAKKYAHAVTDKYEDLKSPPCSTPAQSIPSSTLFTSELKILIGDQPTGYEYHHDGDEDHWLSEKNLDSVAHY